MATAPQTIGASRAARAPPVALVAVARISDGAVLAKYGEKSAQDLRFFEDALRQLLEKAAKLPAYSGWKDRAVVGDGLGDHDGQVHVLADKHALCIAAIATRGHGYPERLARAALQELLERVSTSASDEQLSEAKAGKLNSSLRGCLKGVASSYNDPAKIDKVAEVHEKVDKVKGLMQENVKKILETHVTLEALQSQSSSMSSSADQFLKQSTTLKRSVQLRNMRVKALVACCSIAVGVYLAVTVLGD